MELGLEPEPLAFRVRPQHDECFDSWIERVAISHEITRSALLRHLGVDPALAGMDLALGKRGLDEVWHGGVDRLVEQLAWAVQTEPARIAATFLGCDAVALLPRRLRTYACARCWYEAQWAGKPRIIRREWILRASWRCRQHGLPLGDMRQFQGEAGDRLSLTRLARAVLAAERLRWKINTNPATLRHNATVLVHLTNTAEWAGPGVPHRPYLDRFAANSFHMASHRIAMLALAHGSRRAVARRFERLIFARLPERPTPGGGVFAAEKRPFRQRAHFASKPHSTWIAPDLFSLLSAYAEVRKRQDAARELEAIFARHL